MNINIVMVHSLKLAATATVTCIIKQQELSPSLECLQYSAAWQPLQLNQ